ncbi:tetratricopeptide repeat-containing sensor histidine kinase [Mucilaginibacter sp.]|uniref:tetratricopeptide repeat-containing sensor histidine kinase n=1 Tax=Mucilaginibacter sp. TaxID=1882438 RepID=UPI0025CC7AD3|nr:tetratricopeptide repeat-containing sensor histidine kinase [Mucilaginibacter sp.]
MRQIIGQLLLLLLLPGGVTYAQNKVSKVQPVNAAAERAGIDKLNIAADELYVSNPDSARRMAEKALLRSEKIKYNYGIGYGFLNLGHVYWAQSYYPISLFYLKSALTYIPQDKPLILAECYNSLGRTYLELKNYKEAKSNVDISAKYAGKDALMLGEFYSEQALILIRMQDYNNAIPASMQALTYFKQAKDDGNISIVYTRLGSIHHYKKNYPKAIAYADTAVRMSFKTGNKRLRAKTSIEFAVLYNELKQYDKAIGYAQKGARLSDSLGLMEGISSAYKAMVVSFEQKHDLLNALTYQKKYSAALDSLNVYNKRHNTELIQNYFTFNARLNEIAAIERKGKEAKEKIHFQTIIIITLAISLLVVLIALYITYYSYNQKKLLSKSLCRQQEALIIQKNLIEEQALNLAAVNKLKDKLLAVIGHDLRTPFANLRNIMGLFEDDDLNLEDMHGLMKKMEPVIKGAELTLSNLLEWAGSQIRGINISPSAINIYAIGQEMAQIYSYQLLQKNIEFQNVAITGNFVKADEKHIKVVIGNLISNAIKFTDDNGTVSLSSRIDKNELIININDTGKGIAHEQQLKLFGFNSHFTENGTMGEVGTGIGLFLCKELVEFNGGRLWVTSEVNKGSTFSFSLPLAG